MVARVAGELTEIGDADLGLRTQLQIPAGVDERSVARDRSARDAERHTGVLERQRLAWRHRAKSVLPGKRRARHEHHAIRHEVVAGPARAEGGIVDIALGTRGVERGHTAGFVETLRVQKHPGEARERLDRDVAEAHAVTDLTEHLPRYGAIARARLLGEAGEDD